MRKALYKVRKAANLTQQELANITCIDRTTYSRIEGGLRNPDVFVALRIAHALGIDVKDIFLSGEVLKKHKKKQNSKKYNCKEVHNE